MSMEEILDVWHQGLIPKEITHHTSTDHMKAIAAPEPDDEYAGYMNWYGSVLMLMLLFPSNYLGHDSDPLLKVFDPMGGRGRPLRTLGPRKQRSGKGSNNYRANILEALLRSVGQERLRYTQIAWERLCTIGAYSSGIDDQEEFAKVAARSSAYTTWQHDLACEVLKEVGLDCNHYFYIVHELTISVGVEVTRPGCDVDGLIEYKKNLDYNTIIRICADVDHVCSRNKAKKLWSAMQVICRKLSELKG